MGTTGSVGKSAGVDSRLRSIVVDIGGKGCIVGGLVTSMSPFAATTVVVALFMGGSVTTRTTMRSTLLLLRLGSLLLLSRLGVRRLALDSAQLISLGIVAPCSARGRTFLLVCHDRDNSRLAPSENARKANTGRRERTRASTVPPNRAPASERAMRARSLLVLFSLSPLSPCTYYI